MQFTGANNISIDNDGNLVLEQDHSTTIFKKPFTYQETKENEIQSSFKLNLDNTVSFNLGEYDASKELVIDPLVLEYSTYLGGAGTNIANAIAVDATGAMYVAGQTTSTSFPTINPFQEAHGGGGFDAFIAKFTQALIENIPITATVPEDLTFIISSDTCDLGNLTATVTSTCTHTMSASTNAKDGYSISYIETETLASGSNEIVETGDTGEGSIVGTEQFGFNLVANTNPNVGNNPIGGVGQVSANYSTPNVFSFNTDGAQVASSTIPSLPTTYTASFMANVSSTTPSGDYSTIVTYIMTANY